MELAAGVHVCTAACAEKESVSAAKTRSKDFFIKLQYFELN
jgi:hypothetical protein